MVRFIDLGGCRALGLLQGVFAILGHQRRLGALKDMALTERLVTSSLVLYVLQGSRGERCSLHMAGSHSVLQNELSDGTLTWERSVVADRCALY
jgi:hypothetical protein